MRSTVNEGDEIEVCDEGNGLWGRVRIREPSGKTSIFLTPEQLDELAVECTELATKIRSSRARALEVRKLAQELLISYQRNSGGCVDTELERRAKALGLDTEAWLR